MLLSFKRSTALLVVAAGLLCTGQLFAAPIISNVTVSEVTTTSAKITWITNVPATTKSYCEIGSSGDSFGFSTPLDTALTTSHSGWDNV